MPARAPAAFIVLLVLAVGGGLTAVRYWRGVTLSFELAVVETPLAADRLGVEFYYTIARHEEFSERQVVRIPLREAPPREFVRYEVTLPARARRVRFDPLPSAGTVIMRNLRVHLYGTRAVDFDVLQRAGFAPLFGIQAITVRDGQLVVQAAIDQSRFLLFRNLRRFTQPNADWFRDVLLAEVVLVPLAWWLARRAQAIGFGSTLRRATIMVREAFFRRSGVEPVLHAILFLLLVFAGAGFLSRVYPTFAGEWWLALPAIILQAALVLCVGFALIHLLAGTRRRLRAALYALASFGVFVLLVELATRRLLGFGAIAGLRQIFGFGLEAGWKTIRYTGVPAGELWLDAAFIAAVVTICIVAARWSVRAAFGSRWALSPAGAVGAAALLLAVLGAEQRLAAGWKDPVAWAREQAEVPLYLPLVRAPRPGIAFPVSIRPFARKDRPPAELAAAPAVAPDVDVFLIVVESLRADAIDPEVAPNLYRFASENVSFEAAYAGANNTCYAWYPILNSDYPIYYGDRWRATEWQGSPAMGMLKRAGFTLNVFASDDLSFCGYREAVFGQGSRLLDYMLPVAGYDYAANDRKTMAALDAHLRATAGGRHFYGVFFDATHAAYTWPQDFVPRFLPLVPEYGMTAAALDPRQAELIRNRYRNSVNFIDTLFGQLVQTLQDTRRWDRAIIAVVGDHGEEFGEHGAFLHGRSLLNPQTRIALAYKVPALGRARLPVGSQLDIMPTLLDGAGVHPEPALLEGRSLLRPVRRHEYAISTSSGGVRVPFEFALASADRKLFFELAEDDPLQSRQLLVREVRDAEDRPVVPDGGSSGLVNLVETRFRGYLEDLGFIAWLGAPGAGGPPPAGR